MESLSGTEWNAGVELTAQSRPEDQSAYLGIEADDALEISASIEV